MSQLLNNRKSNFMQKAALLSINNNQNYNQFGNKNLQDSKNGSGFEYSKNPSSINFEMKNCQTPSNPSIFENKHNKNQNSYQIQSKNFGDLGINLQSQKILAKEQTSLYSDFGNTQNSLKNQLQEKNNQIQDFGKISQKVNDKYQLQSDFGNTQQSIQFYNPQKNIQKDNGFSSNEQTTQYSGFNQSTYNSEKVFNKVELNNKYNKLTSNFDCNQQFEDKKDTVQYESFKDDYDDNSFYNELMKTPQIEKKQFQPTSPVKEKKNQIKKTEQVINRIEINENQLIECSKGCGRRFLKKALDIHENICLKVFQKKRDEFDSKKARQINDEQEKFEKINEIKKKKDNNKKKLNWKQQSEAFRAAMKAGQGVELTEQEESTLKLFNEMIACEFCGRRFDEKQAQKHIFRCELNSNKMNY